MNQTIYLAGSVSSDWREQVKTSVPNMIFVDPKSSQLSNPSEYTAWNLHWLSKSSVVLAYMEQSNLSGYGIAFEVGYAKAQQKLIILVDDRSRKDNEFAEHFSTVHEAADICFDNLGQAISFIQNLVENGPSPK